MASQNGTRIFSILLSINHLLISANCRQSPTNKPGLVDNTLCINHFLKILGANRAHRDFSVGTNCKQLNGLRIYSG